MSEATKPCPLCAEDISLAAAVCPYCGAKFVVISNGYCTDCHAVRDANETGMCKTCGAPVADWRLESQLIAEPEFTPARGGTPAGKQPPAQPPPSPSPAITTEIQPQSPKPGRKIWLYSVLGGVLLLLVIALIAWLGRDRIPAVAGLFTNSTHTATPIAMPTLTRTPLPTYTQTLTPTPTLYSTPTSTPIPAWVRDFTEPLLADIANRPRNAGEEFSGQYGRYAWRKDQGISISNGSLHMTTTGGRPCTSTEQMNSNDFILQYDLTPKVIDPSGSAGIVFRHPSQNNQDTYCWLAVSDRTWDIACSHGSGDHQVASGKTPQKLGGRTTTVTLIVKGDEMALYLDGQPVGYGQDTTRITGNGPNFCVHAPQATTNVDIDNVLFWDLNNLYQKQ